VPQLHVTFLTAGIAAAVLVGPGALVTMQLRERRVGPAIREVGVVVGLFALWMAVGHLVGHHPAGGYARGRAIWHAEQWLHVADEASLQAPLLHHPALMQAANYYYAYAHWLSVDVVLAWLWWRHRDHYVATRMALVLFTGGCLLLHLVSTAPPRLLAATHVVDTGALLGQSVYDDSPGVADHLSAMPSIHVGWAVLFAVAVWRAAPPAGRVAAVGHAMLTSYVVVVTGNHFWADGAAAALLVALVWALAPVMAWQDAWRGAAVGVGIGPDPAGRGGEAPRPRRGHAPAAGDTAP
jgi:hypothetical protein